MERRDTDIERDPVPGREHEHRRVVSNEPVMPASSSEVVSTINPGRRAMELIYLVFGVVDGLLLIRLVLKLLGANTTASFTQWVYGVTNVMMAPFHNLHPTIRNDQCKLEMPAVAWIMPYVHTV